MLAAFALALFQVGILLECLQTLFRLKYLWYALPDSGHTALRALEYIVSECHACATSVRAAVLHNKMLGRID